MCGGIILNIWYIFVRKGSIILGKNPTLHAIFVALDTVKKVLHYDYERKEVGTLLFWYFPARNLYNEDGTKYLRILYVGLYQMIDKHHNSGISTTMLWYGTVREKLCLKN